ncbi:AMP-dependent synthetase/ligase [Vulgatibacter sp.]|uniref:AMP-dependent synthetase/ligase n=1 Tax=Vulgatibacter sp. TaxID=1971226 RepID=UPI0035627816
MGPTIPSQAPRLPVFQFPASTMPALLLRSAVRAPDKTFLRFFDPAASADAPPRDWTFGAFAEAAGRAAHFLRESGVGVGDRVLLLAENSPEWQLIAIGAQLLRAEPAGLFASLGAAQAQSIAQRTRPRVIFVSSAAQWEKLAPVAAELVASGLRTVLAARPLDPSILPEGVSTADVAHVTGALSPPLAPDELARLASEVGEEDPYLLLFTSGTTGRPKGVRLSQRSIVRAISAGAVSTGRTEADVGLHLLPFGHVAGHDQFALALAQGHTLLSIARREELERALASGPTYIFSVPMLYERMRAGVEQKLTGLPAPVRAFARAALEASARVRVDGSRALGDRLLTAAADRLVGQALRKRLGGKVQGVFSGGAPASAGLFRFFEGLGIPFVELYGLSETAGMVSSNLFSGPRLPGSVGLLSPDHEVAFNDEGELLLRGPLLLSGYLEPEDAADAFTPDGFFRTGDLGRLDERGMLHITGRKKSLLVLATGKKVSPEPLEQALVSTHPFLGAMLLGEGRNFVTAVVFVAREEVERLERVGQAPASALLPLVHTTLAAFSDYELPKRLHVAPGAPEDYPDLLTPSLKIKREAVLQWLGPAVQALYAKRE